MIRSTVNATEIRTGKAEISSVVGRGESIEHVVTDAAPAGVEVKDIDARGAGQSTTMSNHHNGTINTSFKASGVTEAAGLEGAYTPANAVAPHTLGDLNSTNTVVTASPQTTWTTGSFVTLGDATTAYWDGSIWVEGVAPA